MFTKDSIQFGYVFQEEALRRVCVLDSTDLKEETGTVGQLYGQMLYLYFSLVADKSESTENQTCM